MICAYVCSTQATLQTLCCHKCIIVVSLVVLHQHGTQTQPVQQWANCTRLVLNSSCLQVCCITNPIWVIKTRLQLQRGPGPAVSPRLRQSVTHLRAVAGPYRGLAHAVKQIAKEEGIRGFYKGLLPSLLLVSCDQTLIPLHFAHVLGVVGTSHVQVWAESRDCRSDQVCLEIDKYDSSAALTAV